MKIHQLGQLNTMFRSKNTTESKAKTEAVKASVFIEM